MDSSFQSFLLVQGGHERREGGIPQLLTRRNKGKGWDDSPNHRIRLKEKYGCVANIFASTVAPLLPVHFEAGRGRSQSGHLPTHLVLECGSTDRNLKMIRWMEGSVRDSRVLASLLLNWKRVDALDQRNCSGTRVKAWIASSELKTGNFRSFQSPLLLNTSHSLRSPLFKWQTLNSACFPSSNEQTAS